MKWARRHKVGVGECLEVLGSTCRLLSLGLRALWIKLNPTVNLKHFKP